MKALITIGGQNVEITQDGIDKINEALKDAPVVKTNWRGDNQVRTTYPNQRLQLKTVIEVRSSITGDAEGKVEEMI